MKKSISIVLIILILVSAVGTMNATADEYFSINDVSSTENWQDGNYDWNSPGDIVANTNRVCVCKKVSVSFGTNYALDVGSTATGFTFLFREYTATGSWIGSASVLSLGGGKFSYAPSASNVGLVGISIYNTADSTTNLLALIQNGTLKPSMVADGLAPTTSFLVLGDSIAAGHGISNQANRYGEIISATKKYSLTNKAVSGHKTSNMISLFDNSTYQEAVKKANIISISIGGNNILQLSDSEKFTAVSQGVNGTLIQNLLKNLEVDLTTIQSKIRALNPNCTIYYQTLYNSANGTTNATFLAMLSFIKQLYPLFNQTYYNVAQKDDNTKVVDIYTVFENYYNETKSTDLIQSDVIHPTVKGHLYIANEYLSVLSENENLPTTSTTKATTTTTKATTTTTVSNKATLSIDGKTTSYNEGTVITLPMGTVSGFVGYTDGVKTYSAGQKITLNSNLSITSASLSFDMVSGASIRYNNPTGMRFSSNIDTDLIDKLTANGATISLGTLISLESIVGTQNFTKNMTGKYKDVVFKNGDWYTDDTEFKGMVGSIVNIKDENVNKNFIGRGYISISYGDVNTTIYANSSVARSICYIANQIMLNEQNSLSSSQLSIVKHYADLYNGIDKYDSTDPAMSDNFH